MRGGRGKKIILTGRVNQTAIKAISWRCSENTTFARMEILGKKNARSLYKLDDTREIALRAGCCEKKKKKSKKKRTECFPARNGKIAAHGRKSRLFNWDFFRAGRGWKKLSVDPSGNTNCTLREGRNFTKDKRLWYSPRKTFVKVHRN